MSLGRKHAGMAGDENIQAKKGTNDLILAGRLALDGWLYAQTKRKENQYQYKMKCKIVPCITCATDHGVGELTPKVCSVNSDKLLRTPRNLFTNLLAFHKLKKCVIRLGSHSCYMYCLTALYPQQQSRLISISTRHFQDLL